MRCNSASVGSSGQIWPPAIDCLVQGSCFPSFVLLCSRLGKSHTILWWRSDILRDKREGFFWMPWPDRCQWRPGGISSIRSDAGCCARIPAEDRSHQAGEPPTPHLRFPSTTLLDFSVSVLYLFGLSGARAQTGEHLVSRTSERKSENMWLPHIARFPLPVFSFLLQYPCDVLLQYPCEHKTHLMSHQ